MMHLKGLAHEEFSIYLSKGKGQVYVLVLLCTWEQTLFKRAYSASTILLLPEKTMSWIGIFHKQSTFAKIDFNHISIVPGPLGEILQKSMQFNREHCCKKEQEQEPQPSTTCTNEGASQIQQKLMEEGEEGISVRSPFSLHS